MFILYALINTKITWTIYIYIYGESVDVWNKVHSLLKTNSWLCFDNNYNKTTSSTAQYYAPINKGASHEHSFYKWIYFISKKIVLYPWFNAFDKIMIFWSPKKLLNNFMRHLTVTLKFLIHNEVLFIDITNFKDTYIGFIGGLNLIGVGIGSIVWLFGTWLRYCIDLILVE